MSQEHVDCCLAPGVVTSCTGALLQELRPSSALPCLFGSVLCKKHSLLFPTTHVIQPLPACASSHNLPLNAARWSELTHAPCRHLQLPAFGECARLTCCWSGLHHACGRRGMCGCCRGWLWEVPVSDSCLQTCTNSLASWPGSFFRPHPCDHVDKFLMLKLWSVLLCLGTYPALCHFICST